MKPKSLLLYSSFCKELGSVLRRILEEPGESELRFGRSLVSTFSFVWYFTFSREGFKVSDVNADNIINHDELNQMMSNIGEKMSARETEMMMKEVDKNGDGVINFEEFLVFNSEKWKRIFNKFFMSWQFFQSRHFSGIK